MSGDNDETFFLHRILFDVNSVGSPHSVLSVLHVPTLAALRTEERSRWSVIVKIYTRNRNKKNAEPHAPSLLTTVNTGSVVVITSDTALSSDI